jgi:hypothetical protein
MAHLARDAILPATRLDHAPVFLSERGRLRKG